MHIPRETPTIVAALSAAITTSPISVSGHSTTATGAPELPDITGNFAPFTWGSLPLGIAVPLVSLIYLDFTLHLQPPSSITCRVALLLAQSSYPKTITRHTYVFV